MKKTKKINNKTKQIKNNETVQGVVIGNNPRKKGFEKIKNKYIPKG